ncbi:uncharacterized protein PITG_16176 [Phytophthora infestans T30-4]|uniref:Apple domain-containing protein n=2 Tax=Phytophthora infestans TaxID=4787 RepID=D0NTB0_PHYIT|nr:uncharacterized protein PITG_16176 [Phytophthora infestans T30-4]EEY64861.1 conserved hypothetical protein [Phytophthora infestans T30-4]KAF4038827.1 PAN domain [Phytophthora infestans]|eukprot:XP_002897591.1 conserved hypothetical protein [Phytophthora infestans T30-4]
MKITLLSTLLVIACWTGDATKYTSPVNASRELQVDFEPGVVFNQPQCVVENGFDYSGYDLGSASAPTPWDCCVPCSTRPGCNAYTWTEFNDGTCWFKSGRGTISVNSAARSAVMSNDEGCQQEQNIDYVGNDIGTASAARATDCCTVCSNTPGCRAYTFTTLNGGTCWLKGTKGRMIVRAGSSSGSPYLETATCGLENGVDYVGNDIGSAQSSTASGCCSICRNFGGCRAFSWTNTNGGTCWLKNRKDATVRRDGVISGQSTANPPAPSCAMEQNVDYDGATIGNARSADAYGCCSICMRTSNCRAFSWNSFEGGTCWLKSARGSAFQRTGVFSSVV